MSGVAPGQQLAPTLLRARELSIRLNAATDELNAALRRAEDALQRLALGVPASVALPTEETLSWAKDGGSWCLFVVSTGSRTPLLKASRKQRILAACELPRLLEAMITAVDEQLNEVERGIKGTDEFMAMLIRPEVVDALKR